MWKWSARTWGALKLLSLSIVLVSFLPGCTIVSLNAVNNASSSGGSSGSGTSFNATNYVGKVWGKKILPYMNQNATSIGTVVKALGKNVSQAGKKYGMQRNGSNWIFIVKGTGKIGSYNKNNGNSLTDLSISGYASKVHMQTGPIISGTTVRDSIDFMHYSQFENQIQFAQVSTALHEKIDKSVLQNFNFSKLKGKKVSFVGVLSLPSNTAKNLVLTPVKLTKG